MTGGERTNFVIVVGLVLFLCIMGGGAIVLSVEGREIPPFVTAIAGTALGALTGYLRNPPADSRWSTNEDAKRSKPADKGSP